MVRRVNVAVDIHVDTNGKMTPFKMTWINEDDSSTEYLLDVQDEMNAASRKAGGVGIRYLCTVHND